MQAGEGAIAEISVLGLWLRLNCLGRAARVRAAKDAGRMDDRRAWEMVLNAVLHEPGLAYFATRALIRLGDQRAVPALVDLAMKGRGDAREGADALRALGGAHAIGGLIKLLGSWNHMTRAAAAEALGKMTIPQNMQLPVVTALRQALLNEGRDHNIRGSWTSVDRGISGVRHEVVSALDAIDHNWFLSDQELDEMVKQALRGIKKAQERGEDEPLENAVAVLDLLVQRHGARTSRERLLQISELGELRYSDDYGNLDTHTFENAKAELARRA
jgi:hypothetical protein